MAFQTTPGMGNQVSGNLYGGNRFTIPPNEDVQTLNLNGTDTQGINTTGMDLLNPTAFPWSTSQGGSTNTGMNFSMGNSSGSSTSTQSGFQGLDAGARNQITQGLLPSLVQSGQNLQNIPTQYATSAQKLYEQLIRQGIGQAAPGVLQQMAGNNMMSGDVVSNALAQSMNQIIPTVALQGYQSQMDAGNMAMNIPGILGQLMSLGQYSQNQGQSTSTQQSQDMGFGNTQGNSWNFGYNEDKSVPAQQLYNFIANLDPAMLTGG